MNAPGNCASDGFIALNPTKNADNANDGEITANNQLTGSGRTVIDTNDQSQSHVSANAMRAATLDSAFANTGQLRIVADASETAKITSVRFRVMCDGL